MSVFDDIQRLHTRTEQVAENSGREMFEVTTVESTGVGQQVLDLVTFKGPFVQRPNVMYGSDIVSGIDLNHWSVPLCSGSVFKFVRNSQGLYVGAYFAIRVETTQVSTGAAVANPVIRHTLTLLGISLKDIGGAINTLTRELPVRSVDL